MTKGLTLNQFRVHVTDMGLRGNSVKLHGSARSMDLGMPRRTIKCSSCNVEYWSRIIARESLLGMGSHYHMIVKSINMHHVHWVISTLG